MPKTKKKKLKNKKSASKFIGIFCIFIFLIIVGLHFYKDYQYKQTNEYKLLEKGYTKEEVAMLLTKNSDQTITAILNQDKNDLIIELVKEKYYLEKNLDTYLSFQKVQDDETLTDIVAMVNTHANNKWYQLSLKTDSSKKEEMIVNKFYALDENYTPENLKNISLDYSYGEEGENKLISYAYDAFIDLWQAANDAGFYLMVTSSYRNYQEQKEIYEYRKETLGERKADETAARPGNSEHQTGLVIDMTSKTEPSDKEFKESSAYNWLKQHAYEFGFIERYPEGKTYITGYEPESWHWRYVGQNAAKIMHDENITYDEYYAYYIEK